MDMTIKTAVQTVASLLAALGGLLVVLIGSVRDSGTLTALGALATAACALTAVLTMAGVGRPSV